MRLPLVTIGLDDATRARIGGVSAESLFRYPNSAAVFHYPDSEAALAGLCKLVETADLSVPAADALITVSEDGRWNAHVAYGANVLGAACTHPYGVRLAHTGRTFLLGMNLPDPAQAAVPRRVVGGVVGGLDGDLRWPQAAAALRVNYLADLARDDSLAAIWGQVIAPMN